MQNLTKLVRLLLENNVEFVLIGGFAATVHGVTLLTQDIDICVPFNEKNMERLLNALKNCHPIHRGSKKPVTQTAEELSGFKNLYLITDYGSIDLLGMVSGLGLYGELLPHTMEIDLFGGKCRVLDIDALIKSKKEMGRPKDKETIIQLKALKERILK